MKAESKPVLPAARAEETRLLAALFDRPDRLRERLILAIALAPAKGAKSAKGAKGAKGGRRTSAFRLVRRGK